MPEIRFLKSILFKSILLKYIAVAALPLAVLLFQPAVNFTVLTFGERVLLETRPVDPRDFLRGDYVILDYVIADFPDELFSEEDFSEEEIYGENHRETTVYVTLTLDGKGVASVSKASFSRPKEGLYLQGWRKWRGVDYGLGVYYVPEGAGRGIEETMNDPKAKVLADVRVLRGRGVIKGLIVK
ncbi:MAG: GDYXXLXY domain-containing protein [Synergistaceae bacterium]|jgi:uncharacterized membrane-anchored protein|nr:GDYXXLXY domain-containing protein [Synergistaceae bacterium]